MSLRLPSLAVATVLIAAPAAVQEFPPGYIDPDPILRAAAEAIGVVNLRCVTIAGSAYAGHGWPITVKGMLIAYLPREKILIEAALFDSPGADVPPPTGATAANRSLVRPHTAPGLDVETIVPIHGQPVAWSRSVELIESGR